VSSARRLLRYLARYRRRYALGALCLALATGCALAIPRVLLHAIDELVRGAAVVDLRPSLLLIVALGVGNGLARLGSRLAAIGAGQWVEHDLRRDLHAHLQRLPVAFYQRARTGDVMSRATSDVSTVRMLAGFGAVMVVQTSLVFAGAIGAMWWIDPWLTLCALAPFPALLWITKRFGATVEAQSAAVQEQQGALSAKVQENLSGVQVVRAYTMEAHEAERFDVLNAEYVARSVRLARTQAAYWPLMSLVSGLGTLVVLFAGGTAVVSGRITLGGFVAFNGYLGALAWPTIALGWTLANLRRGLASMDRIGAILDERPIDEGGAVGRGTAPDAPPELALRGLDFAYDGRAPALRAVDLRVPAGGFVAVVGPTGSGKSTLAALVTRLFDPPRGAVRIDGVDVLDLPLGELRRSIGYLPQEAFLFSRTVRDNVLLGPDRGDAAALGAAGRTAGVLEEVAAMPEGWDSVVGERGVTLSGGQRQRVALARALVGDPPLLLLDDPFASVDPHKEREILTAVLAARRGRTTLLMTHRLRAAAAADRIAVLDGGAVVASGTHAELLAAGGLYAQLWRLEQIGDELAPA